ncbi:MAG: glycosyltransferase family 2 protein [Magnetococcales bacterium]|nr:glycosyltransferase family 2 protein [Magnetococcales bacterium]
MGSARLAVVSGMSVPSTALSKAPLVTVLTSVFNGARFLDEAIAGIVNQTFVDFEFLLIDDASTDATSEILASWAGRDPRIRVIRNETNLGLTRSLNKGIRLARGTWIARQDADDWSLPERLEKQLAFLEAHPEIGLLGTAAWWMDERSVRHPVPDLRPADHVEISWQLLFYSAICHTSAMFPRMLVLTHPYDESWRFGQDYDLWGRLLRHTRGANLLEPLICLRRHGERVSALHFERQQQIGREIGRRRCRELSPEFSWNDDEIRGVRRFVESEWPNNEAMNPVIPIMGLRLFRAFAGHVAGDRTVVARLQAPLLRRCWRMLPGFRGQKAPLLPLLKEMWSLAGWGMLGALGQVLWGMVRQKIGTRS